MTDAKNLRYIRKKTGMIFQQFNLVKRLSVLQNVLCGRLAYNAVLPTCLKLFSREDVDIALHCLEKELDLLIRHITGRMSLWGADAACGISHGHLHKDPI